MGFNSEKIILSYDFKNMCPGDGDGTVKISEEEKNALQKEVDRLFVRVSMN